MQTPAPVKARRVGGDGDIVRHRLTYLRLSLTRNRRRRFSALAPDFRLNIAAGEASPRDRAPDFVNRRPMEKIRKHGSLQKRDIRCGAAVFNAGLRVTGAGE